MKKSNYIFITLYIIAAAAVAYFAYGAVKQRYFKSDQPNSQTQKSETQNRSDGQTIDANNDALENAEPVANPDGSVMLQDNGQPIISKSDCDNDCARLKDNPEHFKYCREFCGDRPVTQKDSESQCESLIGLDKDACWRDLAVSKKDIDICGKISDAKLQKTCRNRVTEEILN